MCLGLNEKSVIVQELMSENRWLNSKEAARYLGISEGTLRNLTSNGHIKYYKFRRLNRYKPADLDLLIKKK